MGAIAGLGLSGAGAAATRHDEVNSVVPWNTEDLGFKDPTPDVEKFGWGSAGFDKAKWFPGGRLRVVTNHEHYMDKIGLRAAGASLGSEYRVYDAPKYKGTVDFHVTAAMQNSEKYDVWDFEIVAIETNAGGELGLEDDDLGSVYVHMPEEYRNPRFED